jgi:hypothetical protein
MIEDLSAAPDAVPDAVPDPTMVSRSGTRHIIGPAGQSPIGCTRALCGYSMHPDEESPTAVRDCDFCAREVAEARRETT